MLLVNSTIRFTKKDKVYSASKIRPMVNFGNGMLFSFNLLHSPETLEPNTDYNATFEFFSINEEAYTCIKDLLINSKDVVVQESSKNIIGLATLHDYDYIS